MRYFASACAHSGKLGEQTVAVVVKIADQRHVAAHVIQHLADARHLRGGLGSVHGDAHQFGTGLGQFIHLTRSALRIGGVGVGHGLHHDGRIATDDHFTNH